MNKSETENNSLRVTPSPIKQTEMTTLPQTGMEGQK